MSNPSTIWAQLAVPNPAAGSVPFVASDNATIVTDVLNLYYDPVNFNFGLKYKIKFGYLYSPAAGTSVVNNATSGRVTIPAGSSQVSVTNSQIGANTIVFHTLETVDATATFIKAVLFNTGSQLMQFITNANATAPVQIAWMLVN